MLPKPYGLRPLPNRGRDGDTESLASVPSLRSSESTIDSTSTSSEPSFELPSNKSFIQSPRKSAISCVVHLDSVQVSDSQQKLTCQTCNTESNQALLECTRCAIQQCQSCYNAQDLWRANMPVFVTHPNGIISHSRYREWTEIGKNVRKPDEHPVSLGSRSNEYYLGDRERSHLETFATRPNTRETHPPNIESSPDAVIDEVSSQSSSTDGSCATTRGFIETRKEQAIEQIIRAITQWLRPQFLQAHNISRGTGAGSSESGRTSTGIQDQKSASQGQPAIKRKLSDGNDDEGENGEDDRVHSEIDDRKGKGKEIQRFACPYFKNNPTKYQGWPICPGPGWVDVHRVKEHLYRRHRQAKFRCARCWVCFESEQDYVDHQRASIPCELRESEPIEGFDAEQERQLKSRKKKSHIVSEIDKWRAVFQILFPHVLPDEIPSPFYEYGQLTSLTTRSNGTLTECEEFVLREIPLRLRKILTPEFDRDFQILEQSLKARAIEHTKTIIAGLFQEFRKLHQHGTVPTTTSVSGESQGHIGLSQAQSSWFDAPENSMNFLDVADLDIDFSFANEGLSLFGPVQLQDIDGAPRDRESSAQKHSDSGYESNNPERPNEHVTDEE
ncbi:hypothetical protein GGR55DRAFT_677054 [Xylaria sp. FL0064]|nr:hypothetical protein GGR55DRAFT_677054 [Xylaria sp. FL0064]